MNGSISFESEINKGSTFTFTVKVKKSDKSVLPIINDASLYDISGKRVIIIDNNDISLYVLNELSKEWKLIPTIIKTSSEAIELIKSSKHFDLIMTNFYLQDKSVIELCKDIQEYFKDNPFSLPIITFVNSKENIESLSNNCPFYEKCEFCLYISKPIKHSQLFNSVVELLSNKQHRIIEHIRESTEENLSKIMPLRILVAEDNFLNLKLMLRILSKLGYIADTAGNGLEVLEQVKQKSYDIIFMDIQMPEMDGLEATKKILTKYKTASPIIIAITAEIMEESKQISNLLIKWGKNRIL